MQTYMSLVPFVLLATTKPVKILVTELLIYNRNYLENGILEYCSWVYYKIQKSQQSKAISNQFKYLYFLPLEIVKHAHENRKAD